MPIELDFVQDLAGTAIENILQVLPGVSATQREALLAALNALDDIEAMLGTAQALAPVLVAAEAEAEAEDFSEVADLAAARQVPAARPRLAAMACSALAPAAPPRRRAAGRQRAELAALPIGA